MSQYNFKAMAPKEYLSTPSKYRTNNDFSLVLNDATNYFFTANTISKLEDESDVEYAAKVMDAYADTESGKQYLSTIGDIAHRLGSTFTDAFDVITKGIAPEVSKIMKSIDTRANKKLRIATSYQDDHGDIIPNSSHRFYLLDIDDLYTRYQSVNSEIAANLCKRYNYNVNYLNSSNVNGLIARMDSTSTIDGISNQTLNAIMEDVVISVSSSSDDEVVINTDHPDDVTVEGATPNVVKEDDSSESSADQESPEADDVTQVTTETDEDAGGANINVVSGGDGDTTININVNGENLEATQDEKELIAMIVKACVSQPGFDTLRKKLFAPKGQVRGETLTNVLYFVRDSIYTSLSKAFEAHLSDLQYLMVQDNLKNIHDLQLASLLYLDIFSVTFANKIFISESLLNKNLVNKAKADGIDIYSLLSNYLRVYHNKNKHDLYYDYMEHKDMVGGVDYEVVLSKAYSIEQKLTDAHQATRKDYERLLVSSRLDAFREVITEYFTAVSEKTIDDLGQTSGYDRSTFLKNIQQRVQAACMELEHNSNANAEDLVYDIIMNTWYGNTLVFDIHKRLMSYVKRAAASKTLNQKDLAMIKARVIAELGSDYIIKNFVVA